MPPSVRILTTSPSDMPVWRNVWEALDAKGVYHSPEYIAFLERQWGMEAELFLYGDERRFVYYPYFKRGLAGLPAARAIGAEDRQDIVSSWYYGGPLVQDPQGDGADLAAGFREAFGAHARERGWVTEFVRFDPGLGNHRLFEPGEVEMERETVWVDLAAGRESVEAGFSDANRRALRKAKQGGYVVVEAPARDDAPWVRFHRIYAEEMRRKGGADRLRFGEAFFLDMGRSLAHSACLLEVRRGDKACGGFLVAHDTERAYHFLSASLPEHWPMRVNNLLFTEAVFWALDKGKRVFDFMGGRPGVFRFKSNFSPLRGRFFIMKKVLDPNAYAALAGETGQAGGYFPAYRGGG